MLHSAAVATSAAEGIDTFGSTAANVNGLASATLTSNSNANVNVSIFRAIAKNVRGMADEDRIRELLHETKTLDENWDVLILSETWREEEFEMWTTNDGHLFANAGCVKKRRGVGFLVHSKWVPFITQFVAINERVSYVRIVKGRLKLKIVAVYFPHSGYSDEAVQFMYDTLGEVVAEAKNKKEHIIIAGDFNAEIGIRKDTDDKRFIGERTMGEGNYRGFWLKRWCEMQSLTIANSLYPKRDENIATYIGPNGRPRQIDFVMVCSRARRLLRNAGSTSDVNVWSDHRSVEACFELRGRAKSRKKSKKRRPQWKDVDKELFEARTEELLRACDLSQSLQTRCKQIERVLVEATMTFVDRDEPQAQQMDEKLRDLIQRRKGLSDNCGERRELSKQIQREIRKERRARQHQQIAETLAKFEKLKSIPHIKSVRKKTMIVKMVSKDGKTESDRTSIANIFADFYEQLYAARSETFASLPQDDGSEDIALFTRDELVRTMKSLNSNRCADSMGVKAEMLKCGGAKLVDTLLEVFNNVLTGKDEPPAAWKHSVISVIYKSGDPTFPQNYRPICIIPLLYKLFSKLVYRRLYPILDRAQCNDQAGFRHEFSTVDHMFTFTILQEKTEEFQLNSWVAAIDFKKAFDSIDQNYLWEALSEQHVPRSYIRILQSLYFEQSAQVKTDKMSRTFGIRRGTKQGDPLSSLLFNALLEKLMSTVKESFMTRRLGIKFGSTEESRLTNLRFADDILLAARSLKQLSDMLLLVQGEASKCGLELHPDKTKIISSTNRAGRPRGSHAHIGTMKIEILPRASAVKYLGRQITFEDYHEVELRNRIRAGWAKFMQNKQELVNKKYSLNDRLRLFESVISPTVLYGSECWTMNKSMDKMLRTTQRKMLRSILGQGRRRITRTSQTEQDSGSEHEAEPNTQEEANDELEPWAEWIRRVTHSAEESLEKLRIKTWVEQARRRKWRWAAKLYCETEQDKWTNAALAWNPQVHFDHPKPTARRKQAGPKKRWTDELEHFVRTLPQQNTTLKDVCTDPNFWQTYENDYVKIV